MVIRFAVIHGHSLRCHSWSFASLSFMVIRFAVIHGHSLRCHSWSLASLSFMVTRFAVIHGHSLRCHSWSFASLSFMVIHCCLLFFRNSVRLPNTQASVNPDRFCPRSPFHPFAHSILHSSFFLKQHNIYEFLNIY